MSARWPAALHSDWRFPFASVARLTAVSTSASMNLLSIHRMQRSPSPPLSGWGGVLCALAMAAALLFAEAATASVTDRIIAVVNTELIMLSELKAEVASEERRIQDTYRGAELKRRLQQVQYMGLTRMIERKLQLQTAKTKGVEV